MAFSDESFNFINSKNPTLVQVYEVKVIDTYIFPQLLTPPVAYKAAS